MTRKHVDDSDDAELMEAARAMVKPDEMREQWNQLQAFSESLDCWGSAAEVLSSVRSVPTVFPMFDRATRVGGYPIDRVNLVHGPSNHGKTAFTLGLGLSFLKRGHIYAHIDAEHTTPDSWIRKLYREQADNPGFIAKRPANYEDAIDSVQALADKLVDARAKGLVEEDTTALVVVDSVRKLMPKHLLEKIRKEGADGLGGRAGQLKAAMNQSWLDQLTPLTDTAGISVLFIARETQRVDATEMDKKYGNDWQIQGGSGLVYDSSLVIRLKRANWVYSGSGQNKKVVGERIRASIWKTKVENKDDKKAVGYFHLSNGAVSPEGFDLARDLMEMGKEYGIIQAKGSWFSYNGEKLGQGEGKVVEALNSNPLMMEEIEQACRDRFDPEDVEEVSE
jgi:recombination protein RecA